MVTKEWLLSVQGDDGTGVSALGEVLPTTRGERPRMFSTFDYVYKLDTRSTGFVSAHFSDAGDRYSGNPPRNMYLR